MTSSKTLGQIYGEAKADAQLDWMEKNLNSPTVVNQMVGHEEGLQAVSNYARSTDPVKKQLAEALKLIMKSDILSQSSFVAWEEARVALAAYEKELE